MNNGSGQAQPQQQQQRKVVLFRPEQMRVLPEQFTAEEKQKWEQGLRALWTTIEKNTADTQPHQDAKRKLFEFSRTLQAKLAAAQAQRAQQAAVQGQNPAARPTGQAQQPQQTQGADGNRPKPQINPKLMDHVTKFPFQFPPHLTAGTPEAQTWLQNSKNQYLKALVSMEQGASRISAYEAALKKREEEGKPLSPEEEKDYNEKKEAAQKQHASAKNFVDNFRQEQTQYRLAAQGGNAQGNSSQQASSSNTGGATQATRPQLNPQQPAQTQVTQTVITAIETARNQQNLGPRPMAQNGQMQQQNGQMQGNAPSQMGGNQGVKMEASQGPAPINTQISAMRQNSMQSNNSPQSAVPRSAGPAPPSATNNQAPQALSQADAIGLAARTYSSSNPPSVPNVMGHSHPSTRESSVITNKMPIPKTLPERATQPPQPVTMPIARPTFPGGPNNAGNGVLGQPVLPKAPGYNLDHEGDRVLSKKKLDELVRQVTGGGQGEGQSLMPDVEENILTIADNFVDQVLTAACKNAKERGSKVLEIRDIQLTLERGYNIRIPGYSSDEIRTVRKIQPTTQWIAKMSAVQAAKVTGGNKGGD